MDVQTLTTFFAVLTLCCLAATILVLVILVVKRFFDLPDWLYAIWDDLGRASLGLAFVVTATAMGGSLYYSEHVGFVPCKLCWYQRICMFSLAIIMAVATIRRDRGVRFYAVPLAGIGVIIGAYHSWIQAYPPTGGTSFCTTDAPCTARYIWEFGFVSLPFMALSGFLFVLAMMFLARDTDTAIDWSEEALEDDGVPTELEDN